MVKKFHLLETTNRYRLQRNDSDEEANTKQQHTHSSTLHNSEPVARSILKALIHTGSGYGMNRLGFAPTSLVSNWFCCRLKSCGEWNESREFVSNSFFGPNLLFFRSNYIYFLNLHYGLNK